MMAKKKSQRSRSEINADILARHEHWEKHGVGPIIDTGMCYERLISREESEEFDLLYAELDSLPQLTVAEIVLEHERYLVRDIMDCLNSDPEYDPVNHPWDPKSNEPPSIAYPGWKSGLADAWCHLRYLKRAIENNNIADIIQYAYWLGYSTDRYQLRRTFELDVRNRANNKEDLAKGPQKKKVLRDIKKEKAISEVRRRHSVNNRRTKTDILEEMSKEKSDGEYVWGSKRTLTTYFTGVSLPDNQK